MTDLRKAAEMLIEAIMDGDVKDKAATVYALRQALAQPELQQRTGDCLLTGICAAERHKIYTAPPKRKWVGLTDEEVESWGGNYDFFDSALVREVEAKLKEKNA